MPECSGGRAVRCEPTEGGAVRRGVGRSRANGERPANGPEGRGARRRRMVWQALRVISSGGLGLAAAPKHMSSTGRPKRGRPATNGRRSSRVGVRAQSLRVSWRRLGPNPVVAWGLMLPVTLALWSGVRREAPALGAERSWARVLVAGAWWLACHLVAARSGWRPTVGPVGTVLTVNRRRVVLGLNTLLRTAWRDGSRRAARRLNSGARCGAAGLSGAGGSVAKALKAERPIRPRSVRRVRLAAG